jgi:excisionase family DNA binding protein
VDNPGMSTVVQQSDYLSIREAAAMVDVAPITIRRRIEAGVLPAAQLGGPGSAIRIPRRALDLVQFTKPKGRR